MKVDWTGMNKNSKVSNNGCLGNEFSSYPFSQALEMLHKVLIEARCVFLNFDNGKCQVYINPLTSKQTLSLIHI